MEATTVSILTEVLVNILLGCFSLAVISWVVIGIETIIHDHKREKREVASAKRDEEYHIKRMEELNK